jgi:NitT/TauT family transport system ATP-binding protein
MDRIVAFRDVSIGFGPDAHAHPIAEGVTLHVDRGEFVVVCGVSGVGKSSILRVACGLLEPLAGEVEVATSTPASEPGTHVSGGQNGLEPVSRRRPFGFVFQEPRLFPWRRVDANVALGLEGLDLNRAERAERVEEVLQLVGLSEYAHRFPRQLSGGQRQRVGIARALAVRPSLLLMDEPFSSLDAVTRRTLQHELLRIWKSTGTSILFVTHDIDEAVFLADRIILLSGAPARVVEEYAVSDERPRNEDDGRFQSVVRRVREDLHSHFSEPEV